MKTPKTNRPLTDTMKVTLRAMLNGKSVYSTVNGGGSSNVVMGLWDRGLIEPKGNDFALSATGRAAAENLEFHGGGNGS